MRVTCLSMFNNATGYLPRYFEQMARLRAALQADGHYLQLLLVEGDSTDDTWPQMHSEVEQYHFHATMWQHHHGQPLRRGTGHPERLANLSRIWNEMLDGVSPHADVVVIVESDLVWQPETMLQLIQRSREDGGIHCAMVWLGDEGSDLFYDIYLYRRNGVKFLNDAPYHADLVMGEPLILDCAGSCLVMPGSIARAHRTTAREELMGLCNSARAVGHAVILDSDLSIYQPESEWAGPQEFAGVV